MRYYMQVFGISAIKIVQLSSPVIEFATSLEPKLATLLEPKLVTSLEPKLATSLEPKLAISLEPKNAYSSSASGPESEEHAHLSLMASHHSDDEEVNESIFFSSSELQTAFNDLHDEYKKLSKMFLKQKSELDSLRNISSSSSCLNCITIGNKVSTLSPELNKMNKSSKSLSKIINDQRHSTDRRGLGYGKGLALKKQTNDIYPELVHVFYCNMNFRKNLMTFHVKGKDIVLDMKAFSSICCDIPMIGDIIGFGLVCEWDDYDRMKFYLSICRISKEEMERRKKQSLGETVKNRDILSAGYLTLEDRLIHYFLTYVILPKFSNHSQISDIELQLMYAIKFNIKINWTKMIMQKMWHVRGSQSLLPYAIFITKILEHFGVSLEGDTKVALILRESKVDIEVVHKMGFVIDPVTRRTYKHRTDHQLAPTDEPEPTTEPNQPEFHPQSSSSAAMPTNHMIMDELVSLRGYITTRMDAFDTQSKQIHYVLHRLSSRLSNMDVDEDSSEPES
ncbi:hypothetical protein Lal_00024211 [Lupinus albus]|nr:hypothetical protein Lal_00024211 [Lupinus albus]